MSDVNARHIKENGVSNPNRNICLAVRIPPSLVWAEAPRKLLGLHIDYQIRFDICVRVRIGQIRKSGDAECDENYCNQATQCFSYFASAWLSDCSGLRVE